MKREMVMQVLTYILESNLVGALFGTGIAGFITLKVFKKQTEHDRDVKKIEELEVYLKLNAIFEALVNATVNELNLLRRSINSDDSREGNNGRISKSTKEKAKSALRTIDITLTEIDRIKLMDIPYGIYYEYIGLIELLKIIKYSPLFDDLQKEDYKVDWLYNQPYDFDSEVNEVEQALSNIISFREDSETELKKLEKKWDKKNSSK